MNAIVTTTGFDWRRVYAMLVRHWYSTLRSFDRLTDSFYWITVDLILWGITAQFMEQHTAKELNIFFTITASVIMWNVVYRSQMDIGMGILDELWNKNLVNLFASPLSLEEWMTSLVIFSTAKTVIAILFGSIVAFLLYHFFLFGAVGWWLIPLCIVLIMNGWWIGFLVVALVMRFTTKIQAMAWTFVWILSPLSAIYFPLTALPHWAQSIAACVPASYVFEALRGVLQGRPVPWESIGIATALNLLYLGLSLAFVRNSFDRVLMKGLVKVY